MPCLGRGLNHSLFFLMRFIIVFVLAADSRVGPAFPPTKTSNLQGVDGICMRIIFTARWGPVQDKSLGSYRRDVVDVIEDVSNAVCITASHYLAPADESIDIYGRIAYVMYGQSELWFDEGCDGLAFWMNETQTVKIVCYL